jgi:two-component system sensor histidine kinase UhpB
LPSALFRIFQECLTNVARHAGATKIETELKIEEDWVILSVRDNGRGITEAKIASPGSLGILGMKERTALLGGELTIQRAPDGGTIVTARIPKRGTPLHTKGTV